MEGGNQHGGHPICRRYAITRHRIGGHGGHFCIMALVDLCPGLSHDGISAGSELAAGRGADRCRTHGSAIWARSGLGLARHQSDLFRHHRQLHGISHGVVGGHPSGGTVSALGSMAACRHLRYIRSPGQMGWCPLHSGRVGSGKRVGPLGE
jgi:hypothetical protein